MDAPSQDELNLLEAAGRLSGGDLVVHWQSTFGVIIIQTRGGQVFVNGDPVVPADTGTEKKSA